MDFKQLYNETYMYLLGKAKNHGITEEKLKTYLEPNLGGDLISDENSQTLNGVFYRLAFHAQNATIKSGVINFKKNEKKISEILHNFNHKEVLKEYNIDELFKKLKDELECKSGADKEKQVPYRYAKTIISCAKFLNKFNTYQDFLDRLKELKEMAPIYLSFEIYGFGVALACDFLKELDSSFDFPKPDVHIREILLELGFLDKDMSISKDYMCISKICEISKEMGISAYYLDKMWWLISSETFYKDDDIKNNTDKKRKAYIEFIKKLNILD